MSSARLIVIAKAPVAGRSKTRLCPPCSPEQAARLAEAALVDTLDAVARTECGGRTVVLEGPPGDWLPEGFDVVPQAEGGLGDRLAGAFSQITGPTLLIGMDTPQVDPVLLGNSLHRLVETGLRRRARTLPRRGLLGDRHEDEPSGSFRRGSHEY